MYSEDQRGSDLIRKDILPDLSAKFPGEISEGVSQRPGRIWASIGKEALRPVTEYLLGYDPQAYLSTITAVDTGQEFQVIYHFWVAGTKPISGYGWSAIIR